MEDVTATIAGRIQHMLDTPANAARRRCFAGDHGELVPGDAGLARSG